MKQSLLNKLCCPVDKGDLEVKIFVRHMEDEIIEALMTCPECKRYYPVIYGIPIMTPDEFREKALEEPILKKWGLSLENTHSDLLLLKE
ncbi:MAG: Trm112 family protein [Balneolales bacterium]